MSKTHEDRYAALRAALTTEQLKILDEEISEQRREAYADGLDTGIDRGRGWYGSSC